MTAIKGPFVFVSDGWARHTLTTDTLISRARTAGLKALALQLGNTPPSEAEKLKDAGFQIIGWGSQARSPSVTRARLDEIHADIWMPQAESNAEWLELENCIADGLHLLRPTEPVMTSGGMELPEKAPDPSDAVAYADWMERKRAEVNRRKRFAQDAGLRIVWVEVYVQEAADNPLRGDVEHMVGHFERDYGFLKAYPVLGLWNSVPVAEYNLSKHGRSFGAWRFEQMADERFLEIARVPELSPPTQERPMPGDPAKTPKRDPIAAPCRLDYYPAIRQSGKRTLSEIKWIVLHSEEASSAKAAAGWFQNSSAQGSAHLCLDDKTCYRSLPNSAIPWGASGANRNGFHIEQAGFARWGEQSWLAHLWTLRRAAYKTAYHCRKFGIPPVFVRAPGLKAGKPGITTHYECSQAFGGTHWDPGPGWPRKRFMALVRYYHARLRGSK